MPPLFRLLALVALALGLALPTARNGQAQDPDKGPKLRPVTTTSATTCFFCQYCASCHCGSKRMGNKDLNACDLRSLLDVKPTADILADYPKAKGYVVPGQPEQSLVWLRVADGSMPQGKGRKPDDAAKAALRRWIEGLPAPKASENLIVNGSFEDGPEMGNDTFKALDEDVTDIKGWVVTRGQIDLYNGLWQAAHGKRSLDLHGSPGFGGVKQEFATKVGQKYRVTFSMSGHPSRGLDKVQMAVRAAGQKAVFECDMAGKTEKDMKWEKKTWEFKAVGPRTTLEFHTAMPATADPFGGPALDDVKVVRVDR